MISNKVKYGIVAFVLVVSIVIFGAVLGTQLKSKTSSPIKFPQYNSSTVSMNLSVSELVHKWGKSKNWHIVEYNYGKKQTKLINNTILQVKYPKGSYIPSAPINGGIQFYASPVVFPSNVITLRYSVMFQPNFDWVKGGKLPGVFVGDIGSNGGDHIPNGASIRLMWRTGGLLEAYLYASGNQVPKLENEPGYITNNDFGVSLWRGSFSAEAGKWTDITLRVKSNSFKKNDGYIGITVNNVTKEFNKMMWTVNALPINGIMAHTFFGGQDISWSTPLAQYAYFKDFSVSRQAF